MKNGIKNSVVLGGKMLTFAFIVSIIWASAVPAKVLADQSQNECSSTSFDSTLGLYFRLNKEKEAKVSEISAEAHKLAKTEAVQTAKPVVAKEKPVTIENLHKSAITQSGKQPASTEVALAGVRPENTYPDKVVKAVITAYTSTPDQTDSTPDIAATGKHVYDGMIAANWLPFGTKVKIPALYGDKIFTVDDRMNKRYGYGRMDIWLDASRAEAIKFGVKRVEVEVFYQTKDTELALAK